MSPHSKSSPNYNNFKIGRLLGVGKWAHIYLCQEKSTNLIFAIKEIFKESFKLSCEMPQFNSKITELIEMSHSNLMQIYSKI